MVPPVVTIRDEPYILDLEGEHFIEKLIEV